MDIDINGDGVNDLLVTSSSSTDPDDLTSYEWTVYLGSANGTYTRLDGTHTLSPDEIPTSESTVSMRMNRYVVGPILELNQKGLVQLTCGTGGHATCQYMALLLNSSGFLEVPIGSPVNAEQNFDKMSLRFKGSGVPVTHSAKASAL